MKLTIDSVCLLSAMIDKLEIDDKFIQEMAELGNTASGKDMAEKNKISTQIGLKIALKIGSKIHLVKDEFTDFVATYKNISKEEAKKADVIEIILELAKDEGIRNFFKQKVISE